MQPLKLMRTERGDVDLLDTARENGLTIDQLIKARPSPPMRPLTEREQAAYKLIARAGDRRRAA